MARCSVVPKRCILLVNRPRAASMSPRTAAFALFSLPAISDTRCNISCCSAGSWTHVAPSAVHNKPSSARRVNSAPPGGPRRLRPRAASPPASPRRPQSSGDRKAAALVRSLAQSRKSVIAISCLRWIACENSLQGRTRALSAGSTTAAAAPRPRPRSTFETARG